MNKNFNDIYELLRCFENLSFSQLLNVNLTEINRKISEKVQKVSVYPLRCDVIGHFAWNTEDVLRYYAAHLEKGNHDREIILFLNGMPDSKICNQQLYRMINRKNPIIDNISIIYGIKLLTLNNPDLWEINGLLVRSEIFEPDTFDAMPPQLKLTAEEEKKGEALLKQMGITPGSSFICFHHRDNAYYNKNYMPHRNSDIKNYYMVLKYLVDQGYYCIRMGQAVEGPLDISDERIIDYATKYRSDFGDIYLSAKCKLFLGGDSGLICVPWAFDVPTIVTNTLPPGIASYSKNLITIYKKFWYQPEKRFLTIKEILNARVYDWWSFSNYYNKMGIEVIQNSPDEILDVTKEMLDRVDRQWIDHEEDLELQNRYLSCFDWNFNDGRGVFINKNKSHSFINTSRVGALYLRQNRYLLD